jgi:hypothetical protein
LAEAGLGGGVGRALQENRSHVKWFGVFRVQQQQGRFLGGPTTANA